jgi:zinc-ribbon domain
MRTPRWFILTLIGVAISLVTMIQILPYGWPVPVPLFFGVAIASYIIGGTKKGVLISCAVYGGTMLVTFIMILISQMFGVPPSLPATMLFYLGVGVVIFLPASILTGAFFGFLKASKSKVQTGQLKQLTKFKHVVTQKQEPLPPPKFCRSCGKPLRAGSKFCLNCGASTSKQ